MRQTAAAAVQVTEIALLAALIGVSGAFKVPGIVPGSEFQLSAPIAVAVCGVFGFKAYILAGAAASAVSLMLGLQTVLSVVIAMTFRVVVGLLWLAMGSSRLFYILSGPAGTAAARVVMFFILGKGLEAMVIAAFPGMVFTAATAWFFGRLLMRCRLARRSLAE